MEAAPVRSASAIPESIDPESTVVPTLLLDGTGERARPPKGGGRGR